MLEVLVLLVGHRDVLLAKNHPLRMVLKVSFVATSYAALFWHRWLLYLALHLVIVSHRSDAYTLLCFILLQCTIQRILLSFTAQTSVVCITHFIFNLFQ